VAAPTTVRLGPPGGGRHQRAAVHTGGRIGKARGNSIDRRRIVAAFTNRVGQRDQVILVGVRRQRSRVPNELPPARCGDSAGVCHAQIPRMRLGHRGQRPDNGCRIGVDEGQRRDRIVGTPGPAAATGNIHSERLSCANDLSRRTRAAMRSAIFNRYHRFARGREEHQDSSDGRSTETLGTEGAPTTVAERNLRRSRRGREMRGALLPPTVPGWRSRAERFDMAVLEAYEPIERRWQDRVSGLDVAVDEIPRISAKDPEAVQWPAEVVADGPVALARLIPAGVDIRGNATRARIVLFRKPIERRAKDTIELAELLHEILVAQVATYLGVEPSVIDPTIDDE